MQRQTLSRLVQLSVAAAVAIAAIYPIIGVCQVAFWDPPLGGPWVLALTLTLCFLPLHARHVVYVVRGGMPAGAQWTLVTMASLILLPAPFLGLLWSLQFHAVAVSA